MSSIIPGPNNQLITGSLPDTGSRFLVSSDLISYTAATGSNWTASAPTTAQSAIDELARRIKALGG